MADKLDYKIIHSGQKRPYGDSVTEHVVKSELPQNEVEILCNKQFGCDLSATQWKSDHNANRTAGNHFRKHYTIERHDQGSYLYSIHFPYTG